MVESELRITSVSFQRRNYQHMYVWMSPRIEMRQYWHFWVHVLIHGGADYRECTVHVSIWQSKDIVQSITRCQSSPLKPHLSPLSKRRYGRPIVYVLVKMLSVTRLNYIHPVLQTITLFSQKPSIAQLNLSKQPSFPSGTATDSTRLHHTTLRDGQLLLKPN